MTPVAAAPVGFLIGGVVSVCLVAAGLGLNLRGVSGVVLWVAMAFAMIIPAALAGASIASALETPVSTTR